MANSGPDALVVVGPTMPPVHGAALVTSRVAGLAEQAGRPVVWISRNTTSLDRTWRYYATTIRHMGRALWRSLASRRRADVIYVACSAGLGILAEGLCVALARRRGTRVVVHHHGVGYLVRPSRPLRWMTATCLRGAVHIALCECMADLLVAAGVPRDRIEVVSNVATMDVPTSKPPPRVRDGHVVLGHVSNLSPDKGLHTLIDLLAECPSDVRMVVCGRAQDGEAQRVLDDAVARFPGRFEVVEPHGRDDVWAYLGSIDLFVYPTRNDAAPLVVYEALCAGVPVIATGPGCIPSQLSPVLAHCIMSEATFVADAAHLVDEFVAAPEKLAELRRLTGQQWAHLEREAAAHLDRLIALVSADAVA